MEHGASMHLDEWIVEQMAEAVVYSDRDGCIRRWNRGAVATSASAPLKRWVATST